MYKICRKWDDQEKLKERIAIKIDKHHKSFDTIMDELRMETPLKGPLTISMDTLNKYVPAGYYDKVNGYLCNHPGEQQEILKKIQQLYDNYDGDVKKTVQNHHWIEQCILKKKSDYSFLGQPPMNCDLFTSDVNLSLIVGHNGPHDMKYTRELEKMLKRLKEQLVQLYGKDWINKMKNDSQIKDYINKQVLKIIDSTKNLVKSNKQLINSSGEIYILE